MCLFSYRRDFGPHKVLPVKIHQPNPFVPSEENMDLQTTYKQDYNPYPLCRVDPFKPRDSKYPCGDKMESLPTYKGGRGWRGGVGEDGLSLGADWEMGFMHTCPQCTGWAVFSVVKSGLQPVSVQLER